MTATCQVAANAPTAAVVAVVAAAVENAADGAAVVLVAAVIAAASRRTMTVHVVAPVTRVAGAFFVSRQSEVAWRVFLHLFCVNLPAHSTRRLWYNLQEEVSGCH